MIEDMTTSRRIEEFHGSVSRHNGSDAAVEHLIPNSTTSTPWPQAGYLKSERMGPGLAAYKDAVKTGLQSPPDLQEVDPKTLQSTQGSITRAGVKHYLSDEHKETGETFADKDNVGNQFPTVYRRGRDQANLILSGHHRATAALMKGEPLRARVIEGP